MNVASPMIEAATRPDVVSPSQIVVDETDRRRADEAHVELMKADLAFQGLLQPLLLVERPSGLLLVDGFQRLKAVQALRWNAVDVRIMPGETSDDEVRFARIMANVDRRELTKLERAEYLAELYHAWQRLNPSAQHGGDRRSAAIRAVKDREAEDQDQSAILALCSEVAEKTGFSRRSFFRAIAIARKLTSETIARLRSTWLENHQAGLLLLAEQDADTQAAICDLLFSDPPKAGSVADALVLHTDGRLPPKADKVFARTISNIGRMPISYKREIVRNLKSVAVELAREEGWLK